MGHRTAYRNLVGICKKEPAGEDGRCCEDNIKMGLKVIETEGVDWIDLAQGRDKWRAAANVVMNITVP